MSNGMKRKKMHDVRIQPVFNNMRTVDRVSDTIVLCLYTYFITKRYNMNVCINIYDEFDRTFEETEQMTYNMNYGFDSIPHNRLCVPYSGKGMPVSGYGFSNIFMTLILTFKAYDELDNRLQYRDIRYLVENRMILNRMYRISDDMNQTETYFNTLIGSREMNRWIDILDYIGSSDEDVEKKTANAYDRYQKLNLGIIMRRSIIYHLIIAVYC